VRANVGLGYPRQTGISSAAAAGEHPVRVWATCGEGKRERINLLSFVRFILRRETGELIVTARIRGSFLNLAILALSLLVTAVLLWYAFVENFAPR
ncbi:MAG: hypothetical protein ACRDH2_04965, partial [Anaerolineales bacterium]